MEKDNKDNVLLFYVCLVILLIFASLDWQFYKAYQEYQVRKAIIELAEKQHKP